MLIMLALSALVGWIAAQFLGGAAGTAVGIGTFVAWFIFNFKQGTKGLFKANIKAYLRCRASGHSVDEALSSMVESRYWFSEERKILVASRVADLPSELNEEEKVALAVFTVFRAEQGDPPTEIASKYLEQIRSVYRSQRNQYGPIKD